MSSEQKFIVYSFVIVSLLVAAASVLLPTTEGVVRSYGRGNVKPLAPAMTNTLEPSSMPMHAPLSISAPERLFYNQEIVTLQENRSNGDVLKTSVAWTPISG